MSTPQTTIHICSGVRLNSRYEHSAYFPNKTAQLAYFSGKEVKTLPAYSFVRRSWALKVDAEYTDAVKWNYLFFRYPSDAKYYFYFINKVEYINDNTVELTLELDLLQTYLFDVELLPSFIEREHVTDDTLGLHTLDEGLETGEYQDFNEQEVGGGEGATKGNVILILSTFNPQTTTSEENAYTAGGIYNGIYSGLGLYAVAVEDADFLTEKLDTLSELNLIDGIVTMWMYPKTMVQLAGEQTWESELWCKNVAGVGNAKSYNVSVKRYFEAYEFNEDTQIFDDVSYHPKNNKTLTYPYNFLYVTNNAGAHAEFRLERFSDPSGDYQQFNLIGGLSPDSSVRLLPDRYNGVASTKMINDYGLTLAPYPTCAWNADAYKLWLAQNQYSQDTAKTSAGLSIAGGSLAAGAGIAMALLASGPAGIVGGIGAIASGAISAISGANQLKSVIGREEVAASQPDQARGSYSSTINAANGLQCFTVIQKQVTPEHARIIDNYFTMYGYKVARTGVPSIKNRKCFTYVKTAGCHAVASITNEDIVKIESIYDRGVTWWDVANCEIGNYAADNPTL